jgi:hypothetical protein
MSKTLQCKARPNKNLTNVHYASSVLTQFNLHGQDSPLVFYPGDGRSVLWWVRVSLLRNERMVVARANPLADGAPSVRRQRWAVLGFFALLWLFCFDIFSVGALLSPLKAELHITAQQLGRLNAATILASLAVVPPRPSHFHPTRCEALIGAASRVNNPRYLQRRAS